MLDFFTIFSRGGLVLWCFPPAGGSSLFTSSVNALIRSVLLQERASGTGDAFCHESLALRYRLDNEFELVYVVCYQKVLQLNYVDKFLDDVQREFRDKYKNELDLGQVACGFADFQPAYASILEASESAARAAAKKPREMRTYVESEKSKKTVSSMLVTDAKTGPASGKAANSGAVAKPMPATPPEPKRAAALPVPAPAAQATNGQRLDEETRLRNLERLAAKKLGAGGKSGGVAPSKSPPSAAAAPEAAASTGGGKRVKKTVWADSKLSKAEEAALDRSDGKPLTQEAVAANEAAAVAADPALAEQKRRMVGDLKEVSVPAEIIEADENGNDEDEEEEADKAGGQKVKAKGRSGGLFSMFRGLVGSKTLKSEDLAPVLEKMRDHLIAKNVAAEIAGKLCESVSTRLEGRTVGAFSTVASTVRQAMTDACLQILSPRRRVDILRDALDAKARGQPYSIVLCGVNGVGKSTNLAKIAFWLIANGYRVLIAACDTFRSGAVEQLRTHVRRLDAAYPAENGANFVELYEKGYGKDPAGVAMEALRYASTKRFDVCLIDTAGRMQDNEPLMRALAKLVSVNTPDLVLFVGEALVGNEAVDQLVKFNQSLADMSQGEQQPHTIDGIVLTKFDTIDDQVGAAISMTYITGQPIVFVGTGQTYTDLKALSASAVVNTLLR